MCIVNEKMLCCTFEYQYSKISVDIYSDWSIIRTVQRSITKEKEVHWIGFIEKHLGHLESTEIAVTMAILYVISRFIPADEVAGFLIAGGAGLVTFILVEWFGEFFEAEESATTVAKAGIGAFIYLEVLDASFSFDGVIGAFALTNNIFIIALGLGTGAFAVRGLTLMLVDKGTLSEFRYLEHGAFYAIGALAALMGVGTFHEVPEVVTGLIGAAFILAAFISSVVYNRNNPEGESLKDANFDGCSSCKDCEGGCK